ncbi:MAG: rhomboid family intramembrane serine protease [Lachnospiraceae bacterium]|nr:rhomboid family intramembrane serine protease [Lachnospiraceae bacterium]
MSKVNRSGMWKITFNSPAVLGFGAICIFALILNIMTAGYANSLIFSTYHSSLTDPMTYVRFITHVFGHSGWDHLIPNMSYILLLGPLLEEKYGSRSIMYIILVTALSTGIVNYVIFRESELLGASGVCFAFILLSSFTSFYDREIPLTFILVAVIFLGQQIYEGLFLSDNIANFAHIIGGIIGAFFGFAYNRRY